MMLVLVQQVLLGMIILTTLAATTGTVIAFQSISTIGSRTRSFNSFIARRPLNAVQSSSIFDPVIEPFTAAVTAAAIATSTTATSTGTTLLVADEFNVVDLIKNIGIGIGSFVLISFGLVYLFAEFIIPQAAVELEKQIKELNPELWEQYETKLQPGEKLAQRPDLIQELGTELRRIQLEQFNKIQQEQQAQQEQQEKSQQTEVISTNTATIVYNDNGQDPASSSAIIDVEVVKTDDTKTKS